MSTMAVRPWSGTWRAPGEGACGRMQNNPVQSCLPMHQSPRCCAKTGSGSACRSPAMANGRCRMHGGKSPGAPAGNTNASKHGRYSAEAIGRRRELSDLLRSMRRLIKEMSG
ncbi:MAG: HGGxSTG domain-containing protein [Pseudomonadota bacterium]